MIRRHESDARLIAYADGTLEPQTARQVEEHLHRCGSCERKAKEYARLRSALSVPTPLAATRRIKAAIEAAQPMRDAQEDRPAHARGRFGELSRKRVSALLLRPGFRWQGAVGVAAALILGGTAGLWVADQKMKPGAAGPPSVSTMPDASPTPQIRDPLLPPPVTKKPFIPPEMAELYRQGIYPHRWDGSGGTFRLDARWDKRLSPPIPMEAFRWSATIDGELLINVLHSMYGYSPEMQTVPGDVTEALKKTNPADAIQKREFQSVRREAVRREYRRRRKEQSRFVLDSRIQRAFIFKFTARELPLEEFLAGLAQASEGCMVLRDNRYRFIPHPGIKVEKRRNVYYFVPAR
ncbi:MAG: zf-HC2 domain-containing protein [Armatimonadetes bacterium]|nr:zf-HC2 domain-containing protein [Armatimonadota bacterium]